MNLLKMYSAIFPPLQIISVILFLFLIQNCKTEEDSFSETNRKALINLISSRNSNSSTNAFQTTFINNCKTISPTVQDGFLNNVEDSYTIDDMIFANDLTQETIEARSAFKTGCSNLWDGGVVPFEIDPSFLNTATLYSAFTEWENRTVLRFIRKTSLHKDYIYITPSTGCSSYIGRVGGAQSLNLATSCSYKNMLHEIGHAIGFYHEHQRFDRDDFIIINTGNIQADKLGSFSKLFPSYSFSSTYDIYSIMHYTPYAFSANSLPTITLKDFSNNFGNTGILSNLDIENANTLYRNSFKLINNIPVGYYR
ncbi:MAG: M12 family metallopeptidase [Leptospiraceae bacterium]|nr:M12 family metallopeptidase [Leptospiraceae bacterium]